MSLRKDVKIIKQQLEDLGKDLFKKAREYDVLSEEVKKVKLDVKNVSLFVDEFGSTSVNVEYSIPPVKIFFDSDGQILKNERFIAMNMLDLITLEDMEKIAIKINLAKERNNNGK